jgi:hypothetical protein
LRTPSFANSSAPVVEDHLVRGALGAFQNRFGRLGAAQVDSADFAAEME